MVNEDVSVVLEELDASLFGVLDCMYSKDGDSKLPRSIGNCLPVDMISYPRRHEFSSTHF
jgi:hypothetical protein